MSSLSKASQQQGTGTGGGGSGVTIQGGGVTIQGGSGGGRGGRSGGGGGGGRGRGRQSGGSGRGRGGGRSSGRGGGSGWPSQQGLSWSQSGDAQQTGGGGGGGGGEGEGGGWPSLQDDNNSRRGSGGRGRGRGNQQQGGGSAGGGGGSAGGGWPSQQGLSWSPSGDAQQNGGGGNGGGGGGGWPSQQGDANSRRSSGGRGRGHQQQGGGGGGGYQNGTSMPVCTYFLRGACNRGSSCRFLHPADGHNTANAVMSSANAKQPRAAPQAMAAAAPLASSAVPALPASLSGHTQKGYKPKVVGPKSNKRAFDPYVAAAIDRARAAQDMEARPWTSFPAETRFMGVDVECVASGCGHAHNQRAVARVALVDGEGETVLDELVLPGKNDEVVSYLTPLTGLSADMEATKSLEEIVDLVRSHLGKDAVLVGQSVKHDIDWLGLKMGEDFADYVDIARLFRQRVCRNPKGASEVIRREMQGESGGDSTPAQGDEQKDGDGDDNNGASNGNGGRDGTARPPDDALVGFRTKYRLFGLRHTALILLSVDVQASTHDPTIDAKYSVILFNKYGNASPAELRAVRDSLHRAPPTPGFAATMPVCDGVCMSREGYRVRRAGRTIWRWYTAHKRGEAAF